MAEYGHLKISRKAYAPLAAGGDPFWNERRVFSRWEAWEYLLQSAAYADHRRVVSRHPVTIPRGHTPPLALSFLCEAWGWGSKRVRNFLDLLVEMDRIRAVAGARTGTVYLVLNYDYYQSGGSDKGTDEDVYGARTGQDQGTDGATKRSSKAIKQENALSGDAAKPSGGSRSRQIPDDWSPTEAHREMAVRLSVDCDEEAEKFRDHWLAKGEAKKDWDAAFRNWLRNAHSFGARAGAVVGPPTLDAGVWG